MQTTKFSLLFALSVLFVTAGPSAHDDREQSPEPTLDAPVIFAERAASYSEDRNGRALLVLKDGEVVFERYVRGWDTDRPHPLASGTKSFSGVLAVAALVDGYLDDLDSPAASWIPAWADDPDRSRITVRQLLDLSSGLAPKHTSLGRAGYGIRDLGRTGALVERLRERETPPPNRFAAGLELPMVAKPGEQFAYGPGHFYAFGGVLEAAFAAHEDAPAGVFEYLRERVLLPAGIDVPLERFAPDAAGKPNLPGGGHLTAREWARFGEWVRLGGAHRDAEGELVRDLPDGALAACFEPSAANPQYGLTWWLLNGAPGSVADVGEGTSSRFAAGETEQLRDADGRAITVHMAAGAGKQRLYILPTERLVAVRFAESSAGAMHFDDGDFLRQLLGL